MTDTLISLQRPSADEAGRAEMSFPGYKNVKDSPLDPIRHPTPESLAGANMGQFRVQILGDVVRV